MFDYQKVALKGRTVPVGDEFPVDGDGEDLITYCARVSNPSNQENFDTGERLLSYCIRKKHWSVFSMADLIMEIETTRDIGRQILRHQFQFQEFSQRYAKVEQIELFREFRLQDTKNRQNSIVCNDPELIEGWELWQNKVRQVTAHAYEWALHKGMAKEQARVVLPEGLTMSRMYMKGSVRQWFHYCQVRMDGTGTQKEHVDIANKVYAILVQEFPFIGKIQIQEQNLQNELDYIKKTLKDYLYSDDLQVVLRANEILEDFANR